MKFIDITDVFIKSGDGGNGIISFRREKYVAKGGPDGGNGGRGGDIIFEVNQHLNTLLDFRYIRKYEAKNGGNGMRSRCTGKDGKDLVIQVPLGTIIKDAETEEILADLSEPNQREIILRGGNGGRGNSEFATATNQAPRYAQEGKPGRELNVTLELKLIADVGFVGYPNVGKSTLISVISAAKPKIADYHFTTLQPNLGIVKIGSYENYTVADIPGLIEGASEGKGLGIQFLRHVERTRLLLFLLDATSEDPEDDFNVLRNELIKYNPEMDKKQKIVCFSKTDAIDEERQEELSKLSFPTVHPPIFISAITMQNIEQVKFLMWNIIKELDA